MIDRLIVRVLEWAAGHHDEGRYSPVAIVFHWTMAALVLLQLGWGWWMGRLPTGGDKAVAYEVHYGIGILMLMLALMRFAWRLLAPGPINDADKPGWQTLAAHVTHWIFYSCLIGLPITGWLMVSATASQQRLTLAGLLPWPRLPLGELSNSQLWAVEAAAEWLHWGFIVSLLALIPIHVGAVFKHHLIDRDDVLHGMAPIFAKRPPRRAAWQRRYRAVEKRLVAATRRIAGFVLRPSAAGRPRS